MDGEIELSTCYSVTEYQAQRNYGFQIHVRLTHFPRGCGRKSFGLFFPPICSCGEPLLFLHRQTQEGVHTLSAMTAGIRRNWIQAVMKNVRPSTAPDVARLVGHDVPLP